MKTLRYSGSPETLARMLDEYLAIGYRAEIVEDELLVYHGKQHKQTKRQAEQEKAERWSKRERDFGYTRK